MSAYLYAWNPRRWNWKDLQEGIAYVNNDERYDRPWRCRTRKIAVGDLFFLMRLGLEPKGIIGCGYVSSTAYERPHWDPGKNAKGIKISYTDLFFTVLSENPIIHLEELNYKFPNYNWTPQSSGMIIPDGIEYELSSIIQNDNKNRFSKQTKQFRRYREGKPRIINYKTYDRSLPARQECIGYYGYDCSVCGFNFEAIFGDLGKNYIEVHHLKQIADIGEEYRIEPIKDLRPVCANCHRMLHKQRPALSIEELSDRRKGIA